MGSDEEEAPDRFQESYRPLASLNLSRGGSILWVAAENQSEAPDDFHCWHAVSGPHGGRLGYEEPVTAAGSPVNSSQSPVKLSTDDISDWCNCNVPPFA